MVAALPGLCDQLGGRPDRVVLTCKVLDGHVFTGNDPGMVAPRYSIVQNRHATAPIAHRSRYWRQAGGCGLRQINGRQSHDCAVRQASGRGSRQLDDSMQKLAGPGGVRSGSRHANEQVQWTCESEERPERKRRAGDPDSSVIQCRNWLGREGSNLRMLESKSSALPLGDAPSGALRIKPAAAPRKPVKGRARKDFPSLFLAVAGAGGHGYKGASRGEGPSFRDWYRRVAQPGRALRSGRRGRRFESSLSDQFTHASNDLEVRQRLGRAFGAVRRTDLRLKAEDENRLKACFRQSSLSDHIFHPNQSVTSLIRGAR